MPAEYSTSLPPCVRCQKAIELENAWIDDHGKAIHAKCYLLKLREEQAAAPPFES